MASAAVPGLCGGIYDRVYVGPQQAPAQQISGNNWDGIPVSRTEHLPQVFEFRFHRVMTKCQYPFPGSPGFFLQQPKKIFQLAAL